jgi:protein-S-isoprenylcysteine O-methyltransferase Ste14
MLRLPPPVWVLIYVLIAAAISWWLGWPKILSWRMITPLGIALVVVGLILPVSAILLFRREGTEVTPTSPSNRKLVTTGPYRFTRNPMYLGL